MRLETRSLPCILLLSFSTSLLADALVSKGSKEYPTRTDIIIEHYDYSKLWNRTTLVYWEEQNGLLKKAPAILDPDKYYDVLLNKEKREQIRGQWRKDGISLEVTYARNGQGEAGLNNCYATYTTPPNVQVIQGTVRSFAMSLPFANHDPIRLREIDRMEAVGGGSFTVTPKGDRPPFTDRIPLGSIPLINRKEQPSELVPAFRCYTYEAGDINTDDTKDPTPFFQDSEIRFSILQTVRVIAERAIR